MKPTAELTASDSNLSAEFGISVGISGNTAVIGASDQAGGTGSLYVFLEPTGGWVNMTQTAELGASNGNRNHHLGLRVAISGNTIVSTAPYAGSGKIYVYVEPAGGWINSNETAQVTEAGSAGEFGFSLAFNGTLILTGGAGGPPVYAYAKPKGGWVSTSKANFTVTSGQTGAAFGTSIGISGQTIVVGAPEPPNPGSAYVFTP